MAEDKQTLRSTLSMVYTAIIGGIALIVPGAGYYLPNFGFFLLFFATFLIEFFNAPLFGYKYGKYYRFLLRMVIIEIVLSTSPSPFLILLYPIVVFSGYFLFNRQVTALLTLGYCSASAFRTNSITSLWYYDPFFLTTIILISALLVLAYFVRKDEISQKRNREARERLKVYANQVAELSATEERNKIARDIHDTLGHHMTGIIIQLEKAEAFRKRNEEEADQAVTAAREAAQKALQDIRQSVSMLRDNQSFSLKEAIDELIKKNALEIDLEFSGEEKGYSPFALMTLFRAAQEGLTNVVKHSGTKEARLSFRLEKDRGFLQLTDKGRGFDPSETSPSTHFGLVGIRERMNLIQGALNVETAPGQGVKLTISVPSRPEEIISGEGV